MEEKIKIIQNLVKTKINYDGNIFDSIAIDINNLVDNKVAHNIQEIKNKNNYKREKGDLKKRERSDFSKRERSESCKFIKLK
jgi:hypothetical protein